MRWARSSAWRCWRWSRKRSSLYRRGRRWGRCWPGYSGSSCSKSWSSGATATPRTATAHDSSATLILIGGSLHNLTDGAIVGAAVLTSVPLGITTALAVAAHQIPQEVSDYAILLDTGYSRTRAFVMNALSASTCALGAVAVYAAASWTPTALPYALAFAAGSFLYVALSDLIPGLHRETVDVGAIRQVVLIAAGVGTILAL